MSCDFPRCASFEGKIIPYELFLINSEGKKVKKNRSGDDIVCALTVSFLVLNTGIATVVIRTGPWPSSS